MWPAQATLSALLAEPHQLSLSSGGEERSPPFTPQHSSHSILFSTVSKPKQPARLWAHGQPVIKPGPEKLARKTQIPCLYPTEASLMERLAWSSRRKCMRWFLSSSPISWGLEISTIALYLSFFPLFFLPFVSCSWSVAACPSPGPCALVGSVDWYAAGIFGSRRFHAPPRFPRALGALCGVPSVW